MSEHRCHARVALRRRREGRAEDAELLMAPDQRPLVMAHERLALSHGDQPIGGDGLGLALQLERRELLNLDRVTHELMGVLPDQDLVGGGSLLEPRGDVDRIADHEPVARHGAPRHQLARVHPGAVREPHAPALLELPIQVLETLLHIRRGANGSQRVVLADPRNPEHRHHGVAEELVDRAAVPLDRLAHLVEVRGDELTERLRVDGLTKRGRPLQVAEHDRHRLAHLHRRQRIGEGRAAVAAEPKPRGAGLPAHLADPLALGAMGLAGVHRIESSRRPRRTRRRPPTQRMRPLWSLRKSAEKPPPASGLMFRRHGRFVAPALQRALITWVDVLPSGR